MKRYKPLFPMKEFVVEDISWLKRYLSMSDEQKAEDILNRYSYEIIEISGFVDVIKDWNYDNNLEIGDKEYCDVIDSFISGDLVPYEALENLYKDYPTVYKKCLEFVEDNLDEIVETIYDTEKPTWHYLSSPEITKNQWLIHFTDQADEIKRHGFDNLIDDYTQLGLTAYIKKGKHNSSSEGYGFAYTLNNYHYASAGNHSKGWKYGDECVLFKASGVTCYHNGDEEYQTIFKGDTVKNIIPISSVSYIDEEGNDAEFDWGVVNSKTDVMLYGSNDLEDVVNWVELNYKQYRKVL